MSELFIGNREGKGYINIIEDHPRLSFLRFGVLNLDSDKSVAVEQTVEYETCLVVLKGSADISCDEGAWKGIGGREDVFGGKAASVFIGKGGGFEVKAPGGGALVAVCQARARKKYPALFIPPQNVKVKTVGKNNWEREVHDILVGGDVADRLLVGETFNLPGNWSSYPPHKHDIDDLPRESNLEEIYYYQVKPEAGFGLQVLYDGVELEEVHIVRPGDTVVIYRGYHPAVAAPGYKLYYLWVLAGDKRVMAPNDDPAHKWVKTL